MIPSGHEDRPKSAADRDPNNFEGNDPDFDLDSNDNFDNEIDFDQTGDLVDSVIEEFSRKVAA